VRRGLTFAFVALAGLVWIVATAWGCAALWFDGPVSRPLAGALAIGFGLASAVVGVVVRPWSRALAIFAAAFIAVLIWWSGIEPSNERNWLADVARLPRAEIEGDRITVTNLRNFDYRSETDFTPRWEERTYDLGRLRGVDFFLSYWGSPWIAHTIMSWDFDDGQHLAISIETRKEMGETYSAVLGFFRQYELYYVVADERDLIGLRTNHRGEDVYLYRLKTPRETARAVLLEYLAEINRLAERPQWYNALTHNCTTGIRQRVRHVAPANPWNWRILLNGYIDEMGYMRGTIDTSLPFAELRRRSYVSDDARAAGLTADFSQRIRQGLP
jgi:hypothetical protein